MEDLPPPAHVRLQKAATITVCVLSVPPKQNISRVHVGWDWKTCVLECMCASKTRLYTYMLEYKSDYIYKLWTFSLSLEAFPGLDMSCL